MSYTLIHTTTIDGNVETAGEIQNSWLGAWAVWQALGEIKLNDRLPGWNAMLGAKDVWELADTSKLNRMERLVLMSTFDNVMVKRENIRDLAWQFNEFNAKYNAVGNRPNTLAEQADVLRNVMNDESVFAVFWTQTSVLADSWKKIEGDEMRWYDITRDTEHWFLYEECEAIERKLIEEIRNGKDE